MVDIPPMFTYDLYAPYISSFQTSRVKRVENYFLDVLYMRNITAHPCGLIMDKLTAYIIAFILHNKIFEVKYESIFR